MTTSPSNAISPSSSIYSPSTLGRSGSNRSLYRDSTSATSNNNINSLLSGSGGGGWKSTLGRSRQNTTDIMTGEDLVRTIGSDYQEIQKRTLTKWVNSQLKTVDDHITNIETDFKDGRKLLKLLSVVAKDPAPKPEKMNMRIHQLANVAQALSFLEKQLGADSIVDMGNEAIVNGDKKKTLALIFFIMIKYQIQIVLNDHGDDFVLSLLNYSDRQRDGLRTDILSSNDLTATSHTPTIHPTDKIAAPTTPIPGTNSLVSAKKFGSNHSINSDKQHTTSSESKLALLFWVRIQLEDYIAASIIPSIQDFSRSWRNGLAFCLLIHRHGSDLLPDLFSNHLKDADLSQKQTWRRLLTLAFDLATEHMDIPRYLEPEDLMDVDYPHEPSVMMYVAEFYKVMSKVQQQVSDEERRDIAIRRRTNIAMVTGGIDTLILDDDHNELPSLPDPLTDITNSDDNKDPGKKKISRKKAHRRSTLTEGDKERIKADLNSRLMMQLTGHLPRGVNPVLDQLITIHETMLAFINTNTRTLDEIPTSFDDADTVAEYLDALEIVEEQLHEESALLDTARDAKDKLMLPPENADDTLIRLTDLQRTQVKNLYDMLLNQWNDFEQFLSTTKTDLLRIESDLVDIEEGTHKYHVEADKVIARTKEIQHLLDQVPPRHTSDSDDIKTGDLWHPLDETSHDGQIKEIAISYYQAAMEASDQVNTFDATMWKSYRRFILQFSRVVLKQVKSRLEELEQGHQLVMDTSRNILCSSKDFSRALDLISTTKDIGVDLESIHKLMDNNNYTTNDKISGLESQVNAVRAKIYKTKEMYDHLLTKDDRLGGFVDKIQQQYEMVRDWVDQVRVWFIEAERIRKWIEIRIDIIKQRNGSYDIDPLSDILSQDARDCSETWRDEHAKLVRDIDRFNGDDMARLRTHVKSLTGEARGDRDLSPADASTIEITFTTLNMLNQLMELLRRRSYLIDMLVLRVRWDSLCETCTQWIADTDQEMDDFLKSGHARWICSDDDIENASIDMDSSSDNCSRRRFPSRTPSSSNNNLMNTEEMIQTLVALETKMTDYNQSQYTQCLEAFQEMDDLHDADLPTFLNTQQIQFEDSFGDLMKRSGFARNVVEQHLALLDVTTQYRQLRDEGDLLRVSMMNASKSTSTRTKATGNSDDDSDDGDNDVYGEKVQLFKENSSHLITSIFSKIIYTEAPAYTTLVVGSQDLANNEQANHHIKETIQGYSMQLATIAESLENLLASNRRALSLQQRAALAYEEMMRLIQWLDDQAQKYKKSWLNKVDYNGDHDLESGSDDDDDDDDGDSKTSRMQYQRELDGMVLRMEQLEEGELSRLRMRVSAIEDEIDASNTSTIDRGTLINAIEQLDESHGLLRRLLEKRALDLVIIDKRCLWDEQVIIANEAMNDVARELWSFVSSIRMQLDGDMVDGDTTSLNLDEQQVLINSIQEMPALCQNECYSHLENAYLQLGATSLPTHLKEKQQALVSKHHDLEKLYFYVQACLEFKSNLKVLVSEIEGAIKQGKDMHEDLVKLYSPGVSSSTKNGGDSLDSTTGASTSSGSSAHNDNLLEFVHLVDHLTRKRLETNVPENLSVMFDSERAILTSEHETATQISKLLDSKLGDLQSLVKSMEQMKAQYFELVKTKESVVRYGNEANGQLEWIEKHLALLKSSSMDISDNSLVVTEENIQKHNQHLLHLLDDINTFKEDNVSILKDQVNTLLATKSDGMASRITDEFDTVSLETALDQVNDGISQLQQQVSLEFQTLEMTRQYLVWCEQQEQLAKKVSSIQEKLHPLISVVKEKSIQDDLSFVDLCLLEKECGSIETEAKSVDQVMKAIRTQFVDNLSPFIKNQLSHSAANIVCDRLETRLVGVERSFDRCKNTLWNKAQEIHSLKEQQNWQHKVNNALKYLGDLVEEVDSFVENKVRWQPGAVLSENDEINLRTAWAEIKTKLDKYYQDNIQPLQQNVKDWGAAKQSNVNGVGKWIELVIRLLLDAHDNVEKALVFGNDIINQRCLMAAFLWRTSQLEHSAELIREEFLDHNRSGGDADISWLDDHTERLQRFNSGIQHIRQDLATTIPMPVRNLPSLSSSSLLLDYQKSTPSSSMRNTPGVKDETTNAIIRGTIDTRLQRLQELSNGLQSLLDSKERMSRCEMSRVLYIKQLKACETWIAANTTKLQSAVKILDDETGAGGERQDIVSNVQQLRGAIGIAESIEAATYGEDTLLVTLQTAYDTYQKDLSGANGDMDDDILDSFDQLEGKWQRLHLEARHSTKLLLAALGPAEVGNHIKHLQETIRELQHEIDGTNLALLSDEGILLWQKQIDALDKNNYHAIIRMMASLDNTNADGSQTRRNQQQQLDEVGDTILLTRNTLARLYDIVNLNRLCNTFKDNANLAKSIIDDSQKALSEILKTHQHMDNGMTIQDYHDTLAAANQDAKQKIADCKETYNDLCAYSGFIETQKMDGDDCDDLLSEIYVIQEGINGDWKLLQAQGQSIFNLVTMASQLMHGYDRLTKVEQNVLAIRSGLNNISSSPSKDSIIGLERKLRDVTASDMDEAYALLDSLEGENEKMFGARYNQLATMISDLQQVLRHHKHDLERNKMMHLLSNEVTRIQSVCEEQLKFIRQQILANPDLVGKRPESIQHISQTYVAAITSIEKVYEKCKDDYKAVLEQGKRLTDYYGVPFSQVETIKRPLEKTLDDLETATQIENEYIAALKFVIKHVKTEVELTRLLSTMKATLSKYSKYNLRSRLHSLPDMTEFNRRNDDLTKSVNLFFSMGDDLKKAKLYKSIGAARTSTVNKAVDHCQGIIRRMWGEIKVVMDETKTRLDEMYRRQHGISKLNEVLRYVGDIKDRINAIQLSGKSVKMEEDELEELDKEIKVTLAQKVEETDILLASISDSDGMIRKQRAQLSTATDQLHHLIHVRQEQAQTAGNITLFLGIIDQVDEQIFEILVAVENSAPHHAKVIQGKFVKTDLQDLLRRLVTVYKKNGPQISKLLGSAKEEARKQFLEDNNRVAKRLEKTMDRWTKAQASASAREKELHTCIDALNHEFFTKLAMAKKKSSAPSNTVNNNRRHSYSMRRSSVSRTASPPPIPPPSTFSGLSPPSAYTTTRRTSFQSSTLAADQRTAGNTARKSKTPTSAPIKQRTTYVSDPKNELDVQLGRIVNDSEVKVSIKMVSGEVGKYYFGERLAYCRILPSKMVMVRVGGGWVELSQFLKDHGHNDNNPSKQKYSSSNNLTTNQEGQHEDMPATNDTPSGRVTINGGSVDESISSSSLDPNRSQSKSSNRSKSPVASGYMEGDTFIHVGEDGNQVVMKLTKAKEDATTPIKRYS